MLHPFSSPVHNRDGVRNMAWRSHKRESEQTFRLQGVQGGLPTWHLNGLSVSESSGDFRRKS